MKPIAISVSLLQLIANPEKFAGRLVRVIGFLALEFEGNALYLHREDQECMIPANGIWVDVSPEIAEKRNALDVEYVLLEGIFDAQNKGHMSLWSGSITKIRRAELWPLHTQKSGNSR